MQMDKRVAETSRKQQTDKLTHMWQHGK